MQPLNKYQGFYIFLAFQDENDLPIKQTLSCSSPTRWFDFYCASIHKQHPAWGTRLPIGRISVITPVKHLVLGGEAETTIFYIVSLELLGRGRTHDLLHMRRSRYPESSDTVQLFEAYISKTTCFLSGYRI